MNPLFGDKSQVPDDYALIQALGSSESLRLDLISFLESTYGPVVTEWKFYGKASGWIQKHLIGKRNVFFLIPASSLFRLSFTLGEKAVSALEGSGLPPAVVTGFEQATACAEGRTAVFEVSGPEDLIWFRKLIALKMRA